MAGSFNRVFLMGNLTRDVELRHTPGNQPVAKLALAVNRRYTTGEGEKREEVTYVDCEAWGKTAETMSKFLAKGRPVFIEGRLKLDQWEKDGQKFSKLKVVVENFQFVDSRAEGGGGGGAGGGDDEGGGYSRGPSTGGRAPARSGGSGSNWGGTGGGGSAGNSGGAPDDDIPF